MANFKYSAWSPDGQLVNGVMEAPDKLEAVAKIRQMYPIVSEITEVRGKNTTARYKKVPLKNLSLLCGRFSIILSVGLPIVRAVDMVAGQMQDKNLRLALQEVGREVAMGRSLASAFAARGDAFPVTFIETIRSGEESGDLTAAFRRLSEYYDKATKRRQKITGALIYPCFVIAVAIIVINIIMIYAVPAFTGAFQSLGTEMPWMTKAIIALSHFSTRYGFIVAIAIVLAIFGCKLYAQTERGAAFFSGLLLSMPVAGNIVKLSSASQFAHTMSMMLAAGMPILRCLDTAGKGVANYIMRRDILASGSGVESGQTLGSCLKRSEFLPNLLVEMTIMGEATGTLETTLETVGSYYDNEVEVATARLLSVMEPAIICALAGFVVLILFSVYMPMFSMYGSF